MAKQNAKQQQQQITGFHLGGLVPLDRVGYLLAALYENGAENLQIAPLAPDPRPQKQSRRLSDVSGVAGLLSPPVANHAPVAPVDRTQALIEIVSAAPPEGLKKNDIAAALKERGITGSTMEGSTLKRLLDENILRRSGFGMYSLGKGAAPKPAEQKAPNGAQVAAQDKPKNKREAILRILAEYGSEGVKRSEIQKKLGSYGFSNGHFDPGPLQQLIESGHAIRVGTAMYAATNPPPPGAKPPANPAVEGKGKKTVASHVLSYLHESAPQPRTVKEITEKLNKDSIGTKMSIGVELSKMFKNKLIARPTKGTYALLPK